MCLSYSAQLVPLANMQEPASHNLAVLSWNCGVECLRSMIQIRGSNLNRNKVLKPHFPHHGNPLFPKRDGRFIFDVLVCTILLVQMVFVSYSPHWAIQVFLYGLSVCMGSTDFLNKCYEATMTSELWASTWVVPDFRDQGPIWGYYGHFVESLWHLTNYDQLPTNVSPWSRNL